VKRRAGDCLRCHGFTIDECFAGGCRADEAVLVAIVVLREIRFEILVEFAPALYPPPFLQFAVFRRLEFDDVGESVLFLLRKCHYVRLLPGE
jgi:hypothetical protein